MVRMTTCAAASLAEVLCGLRATTPTRSKSLQAASTFVGEVPKVPEAMRTDFQQGLADLLRRVAAERGLRWGRV